MKTAKYNMIPLPRSLPTDSIVPILISAKRGGRCCGPRRREL
jgi:hypothetical protein